MRKIVFLSIVILQALSVRGQSWTWNTLISPGFERVRKDNFQNIYSFQENGNILRKQTTAGVFIWQVNFPNDVEIKNICCAPDSCIYLTGLFSDTLFLGGDTLVSRGISDVFIARFSPQGSFFWMAGIGSKRSEISGDVAVYGNYVYVTGTVEDSAYFAGNLYPKTWSEELFIGRYFLNGMPDTIVFGAQLPPTAQVFQSRGEEIKITQSGDPVVLYSVYDGDQYYNSFIMRIDPNYQLIWNVSAQPSGFNIADGHGMRLSSTDEVLFIETAVRFASSWDTEWSEVHKLNTNGVLQNSFPPARRGQIYEIALDSCNNVYTAGFERNSRFANPQRFYHRVGQLSPSLSLNWMREDSTLNLFRSGYSIQALSLNNCYVAGVFIDQIELLDTLIDLPSSFSTYYGGYHARISAVFGTPQNMTPVWRQTICANQTTTLNASAAGFISWYPTPQSQLAVGNGSSFVTPLLSAGTYTWYAEARSCTFTTSRLPVTVTVNPLPLITVNSGTLCNNSIFTIQPQGALSYSFSGITSTVSPNISSAYTVTGTDANGCINSAICQVNVLPLPQLQLNTTINFMCAGETVTLNCSGAQSYSWHTGAVSNSIQVSPLANTNYSVTATGSNGCLSSAYITQFVSECTGLGATAEKENSTIYPNPAEDKIWIPKGAYNNAVIYDVSGKQVLETKLVSSAEMIMVDKLPAGMYHLQLHETNGAVKRWKFVKR